jgi:integrase
MSRPSKGPRLFLRRERRGRDGRLIHRAFWCILDGQHEESTGCRVDDRRGAEQALAQYINRKHLSQAQTGVRRPDHIPVADVLALYARDVAPTHARPKETGDRIKRLLAFWGDKILSQINGAVCREYAASRSTDAAARRELEELRAAINHHRREGLCSEVIEIVLPPERPPRDRWLMREEAARLIWSAWQHRAAQCGTETSRHTWRHVAKFVLVGLYTGTRAAAICGAALEPTPRCGWIDLDRGVFYRRPAGRRENKKRQPPIPLPDGLLAHLRRWKRRGQRFVVEWNRKPVKDCDKAFRAAAKHAGLGDDATPHVLRHTAATWLMQAGTDPWEAAGYLGMSVEMLIQRYGHHHPNHLNGARTAFQRHRKLPRNLPRNNATEHEQTASNATKIAAFSR